MLPNLGSVESREHCSLSFRKPGSCKKLQKLSRHHMLRGAGDLQENVGGGWDPPTVPWGAGTFSFSSTFQTSHQCLSPWRDLRQRAAGRGHWVLSPSDLQPHNIGGGRCNQGRGAEGVGSDAGCQTNIKARAMTSRAAASRITTITAVSSRVGRWSVSNVRKEGFKERTPCLWPSHWAAR